MSIQMETGSNKIAGAELWAKRLVETIWLGLGAMLVAMLLYGMLAYQIQASQLYIMMLALSVFALELLGTLVLVRYQYYTMAAWAVIIGYLLISLVTVSLISGIGIMIGVTITLITILISPELLPKRHVNYSIINGIIVGIALVLLEIYGDLNRYPAPIGIQILAIGLSGFALVRSGYLAIRHFANYQLRIKLIIIFLMISVISIGVIASVIAWTTRDAMIAHVGLNLHNLVSAQALTIGDILARQTDKLQSLALHQLLQEAVLKTNQTYTDDLIAIQDYMRTQDQRWRKMDDTDEFGQPYLKNSLAAELREYRATFPDHTEVFVTDQYGGLVAASNRISDFYQADETWWQAAFNGGRGAVYISQPEFDESSNTFALLVAVPVYAQDTQTVIGVLRSTYNLAALAELLNRIEVGQTGHFKIYTSERQEINFLESGLEAIEVNTALLAPLWRRETNFLEIIYGGQPSLLSLSPVTSITEDQAITELGWSLALTQSRAEALALVNRELRLILGITILVGALTSVVILGISQILAKPVTQLTEITKRITAGDLTIKSPVISADEIGQLGQAFNSMTERLQILIDGLEMRVAERTREFKLVLELNKRLSSLLDLQQLMQEMVTVTKETFGYYHVHIYLLDRWRENLVMQEGYGHAGDEMKRAGHQIPLDHPGSIVALAARQNQLILVEDVHDEPHWLPNELLPQTQSEIAVPVAIADEIVGVLDVQSDQAAGLTVDDTMILQALADQVAIGVRNARLFQQTDEALQQAQKIQSFYLDTAWERFRQAKTTHNYEVRQVEALPAIDQIMTPEADLALQKEDTVVHLQPVSPVTEKEIREAESQGQISADTPNSIATPLKIGGQIIGVLGIQDHNQARSWSNDEIKLIEAVSEQMSLALENARLFEETQQNAWHDQLVSETTTQIWSSSDIQKVMQTAIAQLGEKLDATEVVIQLDPNAELIKTLESD